MSVPNSKNTSVVFVASIAVKDILANAKLDVADNVGTPGGVNPVTVTDCADVVAPAVAGDV